MSHGDVIGVGIRRRYEALVTMLIYMAPFHSSSIKCFRNTRFFLFYCIVAFLSVLITYFGVNFLLGGMHSYA